ncbi:MAG: hypothetical protein GJV46_13010 [Geobacter sp.]|nr:hypothetical protein [Geobacter sp.]
MALKDILLHLDNSPSCPSRIEFAIKMAQTHDAHIKGVYILSHFYHVPRHGLGTMEATKKAEELFRSMTEQAGVSAEWLLVDWMVVGVSVNEILTLNAYYSDLTIIGQPDQTAPDRNTPFELPERLGLASGRPVVMVPYAGTFSSPVERVMIAWKSGRESSRVVNDALPIMKKARHVNVVTVGSEGEVEETVERDVRRVCDYLARHGVTAKHDQILTTSHFPIGDVLLNHACEQKMDLLAMGAFAPTRRGNFVFGPIARHLTNHMTVPILISH